MLQPKKLKIHKKHKKRTQKVKNGMKKLFFRPSTHKIIAPVAFDREDFFDKIFRALEGERLRKPTAEAIAFDVRNHVLQVSYEVRIEVHHRRIRYSFGSESVIAAIVFMTFAGMLLFNGRLDTYIFWAAVFAGILYWANDRLTISRIDRTIRSVLPKAAPAPDNEPDPTLSITQQATCPACGSFLNGFGDTCPNCQLSLSVRSESITKYLDYRLKYFYSEKK